MPPPAFATARFPIIDAARGIAVLAMVVYHLCWDLRYFGFTTADVEDGLGWRFFARSIAGSFLFLVGISLVLATRNGLDLARYLRRLGVIVAAAVAITVVTLFVFPDSYIFFGILHLIALASVLGLPFLYAPIVLTLAAAIFSFAAPWLFAAPTFDHPAFLWLGLVTQFPRTNDYVPLFPWFGVVLLGIAAARLWLRTSPRIPTLERLGRSVPRPLLLAGRHSLAIYLLHQPIVFGLVYVAALISPPNLIGFEPQYLETCTAFCVESEQDEAMCRRACACAAERSQAEGLWNGLMRQALTPEEQSRYFAIVDECRAEAD